MTRARMTLRLCRTTSVIVPRNESSAVVLVPTTRPRVLHKYISVWGGPASCLQFQGARLGDSRGELLCSVVLRQDQALLSSKRSLMLAQTSRQPITTGCDSTRDNVAAADVTGFVATRLCRFVSFMSTSLCCM